MGIVTQPQASDGLKWSLKAGKVVGRLGAWCGSEKGGLSRLVERRDGCQNTAPVREPDETKMPAWIQTLGNRQEEEPLTKQRSQEGSS